MLPEFRNEPNYDFTQPETVSAFREALQKVRAEFGKTYPMVIGGEKITLDKTFPSVCPAR